jgi:hypothetical protein
VGGLLQLTMTTRVLAVLDQDIPVDFLVHQGFAPGRSRDRGRDNSVARTLITSRPGIGAPAMANP